MITTRKELVEVFEALGFKMASKWSNDRLLAKVAKLADVDEDSESVAGMSKGQRKLLTSLIEAAKAGDAIEIKTAGEPTKEEVAEQPKKFAKAAKKSVKNKGEKPAKKQPKQKAPSRMSAACDAIKKLRRRTTIDDVAKMANDIVVSGGGKNNVKQTKHLIQVILPTLVAFDLVTETDEGIAKTR
jgi:hypothetical protein